MSSLVQTSLNNPEILEDLKELIKSQNPEQAWIADNLIFMHVGGSRLYGINREDSDYDIRGVTIAPKSFWVGARNFEQFTAKNPDKQQDFVIYDFRKWLRLTCDVNPNVVETLYIDDSNPNALLTTACWSYLKSRVKPLINQRAYVGYGGYSTSQLKKMVVKQSNKTGRQYITEEYGFDLKFASHGFRLVRQGYELLTTGNITFPRPDAEDLKDVRYGKKYSKDEMEKCIHDLKEEQKLLDVGLENTVLPKKADFQSIDSLLQDIYDSFVHH